MNKLINIEKLITEKFNHLTNRFEGGSNMEDAIFPCHMTLDGQYLIFMDEAYSINDDKLLGNIWENDFLLREIIKSFNILNLNESFQNGCKQLINECEYRLDKIKITPILIEEIKSYIRSFKNDISLNEGILDTIKSGVNSLLSSSLAKLIGNGAIFLIKKLREYLYTPVGIAADIIISIATIGTAKVAMATIWGVITLLNIYELVTGTYEGGIIYHVFMTIVDIAAMFFTGAFAKPFKGLLKPIHGATSIKGVLNNKLVTLTEKVLKSFGSIGKFLKSGAEFFIKKFPKSSNLIKKMVSSIDNGLTKIEGVLNKVIGPKLTKSANLGKAITRGGASVAAFSTIPLAITAIKGPGSTQVADVSTVYGADTPEEIAQNAAEFDRLYGGDENQDSEYA